MQDRGPKNHLTQMNTLNSSTPKHTRSGSLRSPNTISHFKTVSDSYFNRGRQTHNPLDQELLRNHYKFHKGTSYQIGNDQNSRNQSRTLAQESYVPKQRLEKSDKLPGRRNQEELGIKNPNKASNFAIGGQDKASLDGRSNNQLHSSSTYNQTNRGSFTH